MSPASELAVIGDIATLFGSRARQVDERVGGHLGYHERYQD